MPIVRNGAREVGAQEVSARDGASGSAGPAATRGRAAASSASDQGQQVVQAARVQTENVTAVAGDQAREVADLVRDQATQLTQELSNQGRSLYEEARQQAAEQADVQTQALAQTLHRWGSETQALIEGRPGDAGTVGMCARQCADQLYRAASEIEIRGASGLVEEVGDLARRRPGAFLLGAALIGFGGGRLLRSGKAGSGADGDHLRDGMSRPAATTRSTPSRPPASRSTARRRELVSAGDGRGRNPAASGGE